MLVSRVWLGDPPIKEFILIFFTIFFTAVKWVAALLKAFTLKRVVNTKKCRTLPSPTHHCLVFWAAWWINAHKMGEMDSWKWIFFIRFHISRQECLISDHFTRKGEKRLKGFRITFALAVWHNICVADNIWCYLLPRVCPNCPHCLWLWLPHHQFSTQGK